MKKYHQEPDRIYQKIQLCSKYRHIIFIHELLNRDNYITEYINEPAWTTINIEEQNNYLQKEANKKNEV